MATSVHPGRVLDAVERTCASARSADELLAGLSHELHRAIPHDGAAWFGLDPVTMLATSPSRIESLAPETCEPFWHLEFHEQDLGRVHDLARGDGVCALRLALDDRPARSIRYRQVMQPQGYDDELRAVFKAGGCAWGFMGLYRDTARHAFTRADTELVRLLSGPIATALRAHVRGLGPAAGGPSAPGLVVVDPSGQVLSANQEADAWFRELWPVLPGGEDLEGLCVFDLRDDALEVPTPLYALVARALAVADGRERLPARMRLRDRRGRWLVLHASALVATRTGRAQEVALVIEAAKSADVAPIIIEAYSLSPREREVLSAIARGGSTAEIAAELHLSAHTVRDYVKAVFEKFGVSSRGELVARLFGEHYADPLHADMVHTE